jgi:hypothetical protein
VQQTNLNEIIDEKSPKKYRIAILRQRIKERIIYYQLEFQIRRVCTSAYKYLYGTKA